MWNYSNEKDAFEDVLRLSRGMTFKAAISGLELGGGKAVIIGDSKIDKTEINRRNSANLLIALEENILLQNVGMTTKDMEYVRKEIKHVTGIPESMGGSGDPSPVTFVYTWVLRHQQNINGALIDWLERK